MKTREVEIDGLKFEIKAWTVKDRKNFLQELQTISGFPPTEQYDSIIAFLAEQTAKSIEEIEDMDTIIADKLLDGIIKANTAPLGPQRT